MAEFGADRLRARHDTVSRQIMSEFDAGMLERKALKYAAMVHFRKAPTFDGHMQFDPIARRPLAGKAGGPG
jgi:hypothetical protein